MKHTSSKLTILLSLCLLSVVTAMSALANGFRNPPGGARALAHPGATIVYIDDASAITYNPANLTDIEKSEVQASMNLIHTETKYSSAAGVSSTTEDPWKYLPNIHASFPIDKQKMAAGIGITTPYGQSTVWDKDFALKYQSPYFAEMRLVDVNPTFAIKLGEMISVGVGADIYWSDLTLKQSMPWSTMNPLAPDGETKLNGDGYGYGGNAGISINITKNQRFAATYRSPFKIKYEGDADISNIPQGLNMMPQFQTISSKSDFDTEIEFPSVIAFGYGIMVNENIKIEANAEWIEFSRYDKMNVDIQGNNALLPSTTINQDWKDSWIYGLGGSFQVSDPVVLRAGYTYIESPIPDKTMAPTLPDADRHIASIGLGYSLGGHTVDIAYGYVFFDDRNITDNENPAYNGKYELATQLFALSYNYAF